MPTRETHLGSCWSGPSKPGKSKRPSDAIFGNPGFSPETQQASQSHLARRVPELSGPKHDATAPTVTRSTGFVSSLWALRVLYLTGVTRGPTTTTTANTRPTRTSARRPIRTSSPSIPPTMSTWPASTATCATSAHTTRAVAIRAPSCADAGSTCRRPSAKRTSAGHDVSTALPLCHAACVVRSVWVMCDHG